MAGEINNYDWLREIAADAGQIKQVLLGAKKATLEAIEQAKRGKPSVRQLMLVAEGICLIEKLMGIEN